MKTQTQTTAPTKEEILASFQPLVDSEIHDGSLGLMSEFIKQVSHIPLLGKDRNKSINFNFEVKDSLEKLRYFAKTNGSWLWWTDELRSILYDQKNEVFEAFKKMNAEETEKLIVLIAEHDKKVSEQFVSDYWKLFYSKRAELFKCVVKLEEIYQLIEATHILDVLEKENVRPGKLHGLLISIDYEKNTINYNVILKRGRTKLRTKKGAIEY